MGGMTVAFASSSISLPLCAVGLVMLKTWRQQACAMLVFLAALATIAWSVRATPQKVATLMQDRQHASAGSVNGLEYWECRDGERDWDYICFVRYCSA